MKNNRFILIGIVGLFVVLIIGALFFRSSYSGEPLVAHHHFRLQLVVNGEKIDFSQEEFQEEYVMGQCSSGITETPIHFHDNMDQIVHIHWDKITGGEVLKYYGLNLIGGKDSHINYEITDGSGNKKVPILGDFIDGSSDKSQYWLYVGGENGYESRDINDFLVQDIEEFFGKESKITRQRKELEQINHHNFLSTPTLAHDDHGDDNKDKPSQEELAEIQDMLGNVVIFSQENEPTEEEIRERFSNLTPLMDSVCGG